MLAGLGNPGSQYAMTRHNVGFMALDALASNYGIAFKRFKQTTCEIGSGIIEQRPIVLLKPLTYMNKSGDAVAKMLVYYNIEPPAMMVIHDDIDMPLGTFKFSRGGGAGGHNGIRSIIESIGTNQFPRLKIGIGRPKDLAPIDHYVLSPFGGDEIKILQDVLTMALEGIICFIKEGLEKAMNGYNGRGIKL
ncbi:aminoacyl-tRNA hydrolase [Dissulfurimicrobium hydrothermale]|uniref:aminoacyl-tRNA hydrolase n=1 Tax=Dissulfurimicrobium hydrothermale TaxID=1750598 RepID=UPI001EDC30CF|nr:aminoacyl-tRNA hydrolase [Dissulfurimicrobium hydrothermale]UKL14434.1 aminoacyl-tRNA hydrolase [Dissulfurimicrobium hydrothermale]